MPRLLAELDVRHPALGSAQHDTMLSCVQLHTADACSAGIAEHKACACLAVQKARYDKIQHVRSAAERALRALQALAAQCHHSHMAIVSENCSPAEGQR